MQRLNFLFPALLRETTTGRFAEVMQSMYEIAKTWFRTAFFPGVNLHARDRYQTLPRYFGSAEPGQQRRVLDAGSGNGMLAYKSCLLGNLVVGVSFSGAEVRKATELFNGVHGLPETRLHFREQNLYELNFPAEHFDEIICSEVIEHLRNDSAVCRKFYDILKPGGVLHLCAPNAEHAYNASFPLDEHESGGHVRPGYTIESYRALLEPLGFAIEASAGLGGPVRQAFNSRIKAIQQRLGAAAGVPLFILSLPCLWVDRVIGRTEPFSLYVQARKPIHATPAPVSTTPTQMLTDAQ